MAVSSASDFTIQNGGQGNAKLHPYLLALVRWCVSCIWGSATILLHRLMTAPLPALTAPKPRRSRPASQEHLHPEPRVQVSVLHRPAAHTVDVVFVHGLYGSLANTWRQGEWRPKYTKEPEKIHLRRPTLIPAQRSCSCCDYTTDTQTLDGAEGNDIDNVNNDNFDSDKNDIFNNEDDFTNIDEKFYNKIKRILPNDDTFTTEKFYNNTLLDHVEIVDNYEAQARFVSDLFKNCDNSVNGRNKKIDNSDSDVEINRKFIDIDGNIVCLDSNKSDFRQSTYYYDTNKENCNQNSNINEKDVANNCKINYDSKRSYKSDISRENIDETKADNENHTNKIKDKCKCREDTKTEGTANEINCKCKNDVKQCDVGCGCLCDECYSPCWPRDWVKEDYPGARVISIDYTSDPHLWRPLWVKENKRLRLHERAEQMTQQLLSMGVGRKPIVWVGHSKGGLFIKQIYCEAYEAYLKTKDSSHTNKCAKDKESHNYDKSNDTQCNTVNDNTTLGRDIDNSDKNIQMNNDILNPRVNEDNESVINEILGSRSRDNDLKNDTDNEQESSNNTGDHLELASRASLWLNSAGFMFYSVPHRGSSLADIKTPVTARSVELLEISKDCALVLSLQQRWLAAAAPRAPLVRSLVETRRTLMSVLWLRIVSYDSADPGLGALCGVSVDHREICKPASRRCLLYTELKALIGAAIARTKQ